MNAGMREGVAAMMAQFGSAVKGWAQQAEGLSEAAGLRALEGRVREEGLALLGKTLESLLQAALDAMPAAARQCPQCGRRRRHKGRRERGLISSVGAIRLTGPYWYCPKCGGQHALEAWAPDSASGLMQELLCLLGTALTSFHKAESASHKLLGVPVGEAYIRRLCEQQGRQVRVPPPEVPFEPPTEVVGSCDGTMVNIRQAGWKELKAYHFQYANHRHGRAYLEPSDQFLPRVRQAALAMHAARASRVFWVADAAEWIEKGLAVQWPDAVQIVDVWHAWQHIHEASRKIFGEGTPPAAAWAKRYSQELREYGGWTVWNSLRRVRYKDAARQEALEALLGYLQRNANRMDYPTYERAGWPISSGPMESFCKQLGQRLKGPGMRWNADNVTPMATLVSLWADGEWDQHWQHAA
jgi:hypothetical protein